MTQTVVSVNTRLVGLAREVSAARSFGRGVRIERLRAPLPCREQKRGSTAVKVMSSPMRRASS